MSEPMSVTAPAAGLSQVERVVDTFVAPTRTFADVVRSASWWLPFVLLSVFALATSFVVSRQVGFVQVYRNNLHAAPAQQERINQLPPDQQARQVQIGTAITKAISYGIPLVLLVGTAVYALILWGAFNFGLGARTTYPQVLAVCFYATLPYLLLNILTIAMLYLGANAEAYDYKNPVGTNAAYYLADAAPWVKALLGRIDLIQLWILALTVVGMAVISGKKVSQSAFVVVGLWVLATVLLVGVAAATG